MKYSFAKATTIYLLILSLFITSCATKKEVAKISKKPPVTTKPTPQKPIIQKPETKLNLPEVDREFRAAWIATVANINWPSKNNLTSQQQKDEAIKILDLLKEANFNAVIFQARPSADAMYKSDLEPWSYFLTGAIGKAPVPFYDPLEFWIKEAHQRGMELHVWLNPYRAHHTTGGPITKESIVSKMPDQIIKLRNGMYWMDPSDQKTQDHTAAVIKDLVKRYDIDAIHIDDYFYPYKEYNGGKDFPDNRTWNDYLKRGGNLSRADWRRANVNKFIKRIHDEIKQEKSYVKFGISPFGIWKPGFPEGIKGSSQYDELFADAKLWLNQGWVDYFSPQLYWKNDGPQSFNALLSWWKSENTMKRHLWPGLNTIGMRDVSDRPAEIVSQINTTRNTLKDNAGTIHYSVDGLSKNMNMYNAVKNIYKTKALTPLTPWITTDPLVKPILFAESSSNSINLKWNSPQPKKVFQWILYLKYGETWETEILDETMNSKILPVTKNGKKLNNIAVKSVDRLGNESDYESKKM
ncbi:family 10 glycosylhydrolase [Chryseobacterium sp. SNU WT5]|uniref:glycoside hydrolase family 10 protein n=1 Tax=Chryseobacterium sp. SNU WT5 TaxID=2594269 RepID=UPI00117E7F19|nr:family 10 glycosylhydrolase [Chryseobacterium sp. SNU WT5]QDP86556.1 family 10 glycosylhydrolase [Chryseobacterium sp. SNU WT5]